MIGYSSTSNLEDHRLKKVFKSAQPEDQDDLQLSQSDEDAAILLATCANLKGTVDNLVKTIKTMQERITDLEGEVTNIKVKLHNASLNNDSDSDMSFTPTVDPAAATSVAPNEDREELVEENFALTLENLAIEHLSDSAVSHPTPMPQQQNNILLTARAEQSELPAKTLLLIHKFSSHRLQTVQDRQVVHIQNWPAP